jgi:hypothetical protein
MAQWGNNDVASNSVLWAPARLKTAANSANRDALYGNTTADASITDITAGQYGVSEDEARAARAGAAAKMAHAGWNLRIEGSGGRAGRVTYETLIAMGSIAGDGTDDTVLPDYAIIITSEPVAASGNSTAVETVSFNVVAESIPSGAALTYLWEYTVDPGNTASYATTAAVTGYGGQTTDTLTANTAEAAVVDGTLVRVTISSTGAIDEVSTDAEITVTT